MFCAAGTSPPGGTPHTSCLNQWQCSPQCRFVSWFNRISATVMLLSRANLWQLTGTSGAYAA
eukprot:scaffold330022_cov19-Prasinocladus_malaysianus.AAC.1